MKNYYYMLSQNGDTDKNFKAFATSTSSYKTENNIQLYLLEETESTTLVVSLVTKKSSS